MTKRGMWSSSPPPLGYKLENKTIVPNLCYKGLAIRIFEMYKKEQSVTRVKKRLDIEGIYTRTGCSWRYGALYNMLSNQLYIGKLPYKKEIYNGVHEGIIPRTLFNEVQDILVDNNRSFKIRERASDQSLLAGLLYDEVGEKYYPSHSTKPPWIEEVSREHKKVIGIILLRELLRIRGMRENYLDNYRQKR